MLLKLIISYSSSQRLVQDHLAIYTNCIIYLIIFNKLCELKWDLGLIKLQQRVCADYSQSLNYLTDLQSSVIILSIISNI